MTMTWEKLTVGQFLELYRLAIQPDLDEMTRVERAVSIIYDKTEKQVEEMKMLEFTSLSREASQFLTVTKIPGKPVKVIVAGDKKFKIVYDVTKLRQRQYVEIIHFGKNPVENMHLVLASLVQPIKYGIARKNSADDHQKIAEQLLKAKVVDVYHTCVFFYKLYTNFIEHIQPSLVKQMMDSLKKSKEECEELLKNSIAALDGFILPQGSLNMKG